MPSKSARLTCPDCGVEPEHQGGRRVCPKCDADIVLDSDTFDHPTTRTAGPPWSYTQRKGESRGSLSWNR